MATLFCSFCKTEHHAFNWRNASIDDGGTQGWYCDKYFKPSHHEFIPDRVKEERKAYSKSQLQPYRDGVVSKEFVDTYGTSHINPDDAKKARNVWGDVLPSGWEHTK